MLIAGYMFSELCLALPGYSLTFVDSEELCRVMVELVIQLLMLFFFLFCREGVLVTTSVLELELVNPSSDSNLFLCSLGEHL